MTKLRFTTLPERGDVMLGVKATGEFVFLKENSFESVSDIDQTKYDIIGTVFKRDGNNVKFMNLINASAKWCERYAFKLTGYTLDGTTHTGKLNIWTAGSAARDTSYTLSYSAETESGLVSELNRLFASSDYPALGSQDWFAELDDENNVIVSFDYVASYQASNTGSEGFTLTANTLPEIPALAKVLRKNGASGGEGAISSMTKALQYFRADLNNASYNPASDVTSVKRTYPICLPGYLGTSQYQSDHCALLRQTYGEGEAGWLKFMESCLPVYPTEWGTMGWTPAKADEYTRIMAAKTYSTMNKTDETMCKAASYCYNVEHAGMPKGTFRLPTLQEVAEILDGVQFNVINNRNADILNKTQYKLGGSAVSCSSVFWSAFRLSANAAWLASGYYGFFGNYGMYGSCVVIPVSTYTLQRKA